MWPLGCIMVNFHQRSHFSTGNQNLISLRRYNQLRMTSFTGLLVLSDGGFDLLHRLLTYDPEKVRTISKSCCKYFCKTYFIQRAWYGLVNCYHDWLTLQEAGGFETEIQRPARKSVSKIVVMIELLSFRECVMFLLPCLNTVSYPVVFLSPLFS